MLLLLLHPLGGAPNHLFSPQTPLLPHPSFSAFANLLVNWAFAPCCEQSPPPQWDQRLLAGCAGAGSGLGPVGHSCPCRAGVRRRASGLGFQKRTNGDRGEMKTPISEPKRSQAGRQMAPRLLDSCDPVSVLLRHRATHSAVLSPLAQNRGLRGAKWALEQDPPRPPSRTSAGGQAAALPGEVWQTEAPSQLPPSQ